MRPGHWWLRLKEHLLPRRRLVVADMDAPAQHLPRRDLLLLQADGEDWAVAMSCPCGCGQRVELPLIREATPRWRLEHSDGHGPSLFPSVWLREGCRAHYHVRGGKVVWV